MSHRLSTPSPLAGFYPHGPARVTSHPAQPAINARKTNIDNSGRIAGEWSRRNGVLEFLWTYFFGMRSNFSCRRVDEGQLLMRECQRLRDVLGGIFQARAMAGARFNIFIDT